MAADALVKTSTNLSSDPVDMLFHALRLGIATGLYGLTLTNQLNDIILGEPEIRVAKVGFGVVDPAYINIMVTGHQHTLFAALQDELSSGGAAEMARAAGAKGFKLIGSTCVGQDLQLRGAHCGEMFAGHAGNNFTSEALLATGGIDLVVSEFNCTLPGIEDICDQFLVKQICLDDVTLCPDRVKACTPAGVIATLFSLQVGVQVGTVLACYSCIEPTQKRKKSRR